MKRATALTAGIALIAAACLTMMMTLAAPEPASAICLCPSGGPYYSTPTNWGFGVDCSAAVSDLRAKTTTVARADCSPHGICATQLVYNCWFNGSQWQADGYLSYSCRDECGPLVP